MNLNFKRGLRSFSANRIQLVNQTDLDKQQNVFCVLMDKVRLYANDAPSSGSVSGGFRPSADSRRRINKVKSEQ